MFGMMSRTEAVVDLVAWIVVTASATCLSVSGQDWHTPHGRWLGVSAVLAVIGAGLKRFPDMGRIVTAVMHPQDEEPTEAPKEKAA